MQDDKPIITSVNRVGSPTPHRKPKIIRDEHEPPFVVNGKETNLSKIEPIPVANNAELKSVMMKAMKSIEKIEKEVVNGSVDGLAFNEILQKFKIMKKRYPDIEIPQVKNRNGVELAKLKQRYKNELMKRMQKSMGIYKGMIILVAGSIEYILGSIMGFDVKGLTWMHIRNWVTYEACLQEMGEENGGLGIIESYSPSTRLMIYIAVNTILFIFLTKVVGMPSEKAINFSSVDKLSEYANVVTEQVGNGGGSSSGFDFGKIFNIIGDVAKGFNQSATPTNGQQVEIKEESSAPPKRRSKIIDMPDIEIEES